MSKKLSNTKVAKVSHSRKTSLQLKLVEYMWSRRGGFREQNRATGHATTLAPQRRVLAIRAKTIFWTLVALLATAEKINKSTLMYFLSPSS